MSDFKLTRDPTGRLVLTETDGTIHTGITAARAFPIGAPAENISLLDEEGHELRWIDKLADLPETTRKMVADELLQREFMPEITGIKQVSSFATPSRWLVTTNRGDTELLLKAEDHIRRVAHNTLLITDGHGVSYLVRDVDVMDGHSRKLLDRFL
jgi:hypothetical protein